jgi:hypothetical protein
MEKCSAKEPEPAAKPVDGAKMRKGRAELAQEFELSTYSRIRAPWTRALVCVGDELNQSARALADVHSTEPQVPPQPLERS